MTDDVRKLLAGHATGTLTESERKALFEAALTDEELFAAISDEEPLRALLSDSASRTELLSRIEPAPHAFRERFAAWLRRPMVVGGFATATVAIVVISIIPLMHVERQSQYAELRAPALKVTPSNEEPQRAPASVPAIPRAKRQKAPEPAAAADVMQQPAQTPVPEAEVRVEAAPARLMVASKAAEPAQTASRFTVLRQSETGEYVKVDPLQTIFAPGDMVRIRVEPGEAGVVNVMSPALQPIAGAVSQARAFETGDIRVGNEDMRLSVSFGTGPAVVQTLVRSDFAQRSELRGTEIVLRVKKP